MAQNHEKDNSNIDHAFELMGIDFEQRSKQVDSMVLDRSRFLRIALLVWSAPLFIAASLVDKHLVDLTGNTNVLGGSIFGWLLLATSFMLCSLINCVIFFSMVNNRNTTNMAASGMNYIRSYYFLILSKSSALELTDDLKSKVLDIESGKPIFKVIRSSSVDYGLALGVLVNLLYTVIGLMGFVVMHLPYVYGAALLFFFVFASNILVLIEMRFSNIFHDLRKPHDRI